MLDKAVEAHLLYDLYGPLLTDRQRRMVELRFFDDWSLSEIAEELGVSRQAVNDALRRTLAQLEGYEEKLGLLGAVRWRKKQAEPLLAKLHDKYGVDDETLASFRDLLT